MRAAAPLVVALTIVLVQTTWAVAEADTDAVEAPAFAPDSLAMMGRAFARPLVDPADSAGILAATSEIAASAYADTLYLLFGRPGTPVGVIGPNSRAAGRLGEYIASRDSVSLDPGRITSAAQLRHALAHELAHRWQARAPKEIARLWQDVAPIRDPKRYGYGKRSEHQAEAIAFAVHVLQSTAADSVSPAQALALLDQYELLVPGTRLMARHLALETIYQNHPLHAALTPGVSE
jgi:hypothetical protein